MGEVTPNGELIKDYLKKYRSLKSRTLAKLIYTDHQDIFKDSESVRRIIRYYRKSAGDEGRRTVSEYIPYIPEPAPIIDFAPYKLKEEDFPVIIGGDAHIPYHDVDALSIFFERAYDMKAKTVILDGDWLDMYMLSRFMKDPRKWQAVEELQMLAEILNDFHKQYQCKIIYKLGNHEERFDKYIMDNAPAIWGIEDFTFSGALRHYVDFDIEIVQHKRIIKAFDLSLVHGHEFGMSIFSPVNPARGLFLRAKDSTIGAHHHQTSEHAEPNIQGRSIVCWSIGCLCDLHPEYLPLNKWNHGFAEIHYDGDVWRVHNRKIVNYRLI